jgi:ribosomal protein L37AE/L43A
MRMIGIGNGDCDPAYDEPEYYCPECNAIMVETWTNWKCTECEHTDSGDAEPDDHHSHQDEPNDA